MFCRSSQETRITSTPQSQRSLSPDCSLSTIEGDNVPAPSRASNRSLNDLDSDSSRKYSQEEASSLTDSQVPMSEFDDDDLETLVKKIKTVTWTGAWAILKPRNKDRLYFKITKNVRDIPAIVKELLYDYKENRDQVVKSILQLFLDLAGFQRLDVNRLYSCSQINIEEVLEHAEHSVDAKEAEGFKFVFMRESQYFDKYEIIATIFFHHLIFESFNNQSSDGRNILTDQILTRHMFEFIRCMSFHTVRPLRMTGIMLGLKVLTDLTNLYSQFQTFLMESQANIDREELEDRKVLETYIDFFYMICDKNCLLPDPTFNIIRAKCAQEMIKWITVFPDIFLLSRHRCTLKLMKLVNDNDPIVRKSALDTCEKLMTSDRFCEQLKHRMEMFVHVVAGRRLDVDYEIAAKAVKILRLAIDRYFPFITSEVKTSIMNLMYQKNLPLAKAAGEFTDAFFRKENKNGRLLLLSLAQISGSDEEFDKRRFCLVEVCWDYCPELTNWDLITSMLLDSSLSMSLRKSLLGLVNESVCHYLTGNFSRARNGTELQARATVSTNHAEVAKFFLPCIKQLFIEFKTDQQCLNDLLQIVLYLDFSCSRLKTEHCRILLSVLVELFHVTVDKSILSRISQLFYNLCERNRSHQDDIRDLVGNLKEKSAKILLEDLSKLGPDSDESELLHLKKYSFKISILCEQFNFNNFLMWEDIFARWNTADFSTALKYLNSCCKWHLIWSLRHHLEEFPNHRLYNNCKEFINNSLEILKISKHYSATILVFENLCDLYNIFANELKRKKQYHNFLIKITDESDQLTFMNYLTHSVIENKTLPLERRQLVFGKAVDVLYLDMLPTENFSRILFYYHTHHMEFGKIMDNIMAELKRANPALPVIIMDTLARIYKKILARHHVVDIRSDEVKPLKQLSKQLAASKELRLESDLCKLVNMAITFGCNMKNYSFLYFVKPFLRNLKNDAKNDLYCTFKRVIPASDQSNEMVVKFGTWLTSAKIE